MARHPHKRITPRLKVHRTIYRLSGIQGNLASLLWDHRDDDEVAKALITLLEQITPLIETLYKEKSSL